jgi:hypothetical protein
MWTYRTSQNPWLHHLFTFTNRRPTLRLLMPHREVNFELDSASVSGGAAANASVTDNAVQRIVGEYDLHGRLRRLGLKASWFDLILVVYLAGFLRQYFWIVSDNTTAWILTGLFSILLLAKVTPWIVSW